MEGIIGFLARKHKHALMRYDFCEPQTGKDICDRKISPIKRAIIEFVNNNNNVVNPSGMKKAIESAHLNGLICLVCEMNETLDFNDDFVFKKITKFYSFEYIEEKIKSFNFFNVGNGVEIN